MDGQTHLAIPREIQRDHIHGRFIHIDFLAVRRDERITLAVEVHEVGEAPGSGPAACIEHHLREIEIECLPNDVPEAIPADVSAMEIGDMLRVGDIAVPNGVTFLTPADTPVISVITPAALRVEADLTLPGEEAPEAPAEEEEAAEVAEGEAPFRRGSRRGRRRGVAPRDGLARRRPRQSRRPLRTDPPQHREAGRGGARAERGRAPEEGPVPPGRARRGAEGDERVLLVTSTRFMNESGPSYAGLAKKHDVPPERIVAVHDELEIPPGELHVKLGGGSGGHNGLKSLTQALRTPEYHRVRVGIGRPPGRQDPADYVLEPIGKRVEADIASVGGPGG